MQFNSLVNSFSGMWSFLLEESADLMMGTKEIKIFPRDQGFYQISDFAVIGCPRT